MDIKNSIFNQLKRIDIFGFNFPLRYQKEKEYNTIFGIVFSIFSIIIILLITFLYLKEMINKSNFSIVTNYIYSEENFQIDISSFPLMLSLINYKLEKDIDDSYALFVLDLNIYTPITNNIGLLILNKTTYSIELEMCSSSNFGNYINMFKNYEYTKNICIKPNQKILLEGRFGDQVKGYTTLDIHLIKCVNSTNNNNRCKSKEKINEYLLNSYVSLFYISQTIDHYNVSNPVINLLNSDTFSISPQNIKRFYYFYSKEKYISDNGVIFKNKKEYDLFQNHHTNFDLIEKDSSNEILLDIIFSCHNLKTLYEREYLKIQDILGIIGGFFDIISNLFYFISYNLIKKSFMLHIGNSFISYNYKILTNNSEFSNQNLLQIKKKNTVPYNNNYIENINTCKLFNLNTNKNILNQLNIKDEQLSILKQYEKKEKNWYYYLLYYIFPLCFFKNLKHYQIYVIYLDVFDKFLSIDFLIPMILNSYQSIKNKSYDK